MKTSKNIVGQQPLTPPRAVDPATHRPASFESDSILLATEAVRRACPQILPRGNDSWAERRPTAGIAIPIAFKIRDRACFATNRRPRSGLERADGMDFASWVDGMAFVARKLPMLSTACPDVPARADWVGCRHRACPR
jgi:hypothetical protein